MPKVYPPYVKLFETARCLIKSLLVLRRNSRVMNTENRTMLYLIGSDRNGEEPEKGEKVDERGLLHP